MEQCTIAMNYKAKQVKDANFPEFINIIKAILIKTWPYFVWKLSS